MELPTHCHSCGAYLAGSWTKHKPECSILKIITEVIRKPKSKRKKKMEGNRENQE